MHVLYVSADPGVPVLGHKGASVHVRELSEALVGAGARVTIASPRIAPEGDRLAPSLALTAIPPILPREHESETTLRAAMLMQRSTLATVARRLRVDAIYERYSLFTHAGVEVAAELGVCHVLEVNAPLRAEAERFRTLPHPLVAECIEQHVFERTERILTVSPPLAELVRRAGVAAEKIEVVPNAVAPGKFGPRRSRSDDLLVAGFVGSLKPWHGIDVLVAAAQIALAVDPRVRLEVIGA